MATFQINLAVNVETDNIDDAAEISENLAKFLGMHFETSTQGAVTDIYEVVEEEVEAVNV